ncbi:MAG: hydantoinase B/oxoprolinase family protein, partial [Marinomonas sp.]
QNIPMIDRETLAAGAVVKGPAIIVEPTGTNMIEPGWQGTIDAHGNLILERFIAAKRMTAMGTDADPIMLEVFNNLFMSIAEQMGATLANTAYSVNIKERFDFSCALFDSTGGLVANAPHVPVHLGSMGESVRTVARLNEGQIKPGDSFMLNNPYNGGTHLPDVTVITPVFDKQGETILFYVGSRGHHADIGGRTPGSAPPDSKHIEEEGVVIDNFRLVDGGTLRESETRALLASGKYPCRNIEENMADLEAQIAANSTGIREVHRMMDTFGLDVVLAYMGHVQANAEASVREVIGRLKDSSFTYPLDEGQEIKVKISVDQQAREATIDFTGTSSQDVGNYNAPSAV